MSFCTSLRHFIQIGPSSAEKNDVRSIFRMADPATLDFRGPVMRSLKRPGTTSYRLSIDTIALNCLVFEKISFFLHFGDRQTDKQMDSTDAQSHSRYRERQLNKEHYLSVSLCSSKSTKTSECTLYNCTRCTEHYSQNV